jgi:tetratricopeptide (TPR) repeat protein
MYRPTKSGAFCVVAKHFILYFLPIILFLVQPAIAVTKIVVFPLVNKSGDRSQEWASFMTAEHFSRQIQYCSDLQVLDPTFLFSVDSTGWTMTSDSLLKNHWMRWGWNVACGGSYTVSQGKINCDLKILYLKNGRPQKKNVSRSLSVDSVDALVSDLFSAVTSTIGYSLSKAEQQALRRPMTVSPSARATYCAGFGFEMKKNIPAALTSYGRCIELDPSFTHAFYRMARLYRVCGAMDRARELFGRAVSQCGDAPVIIADAADFYVGNDPAVKALDFINKHRAVLEQTAEGMSAIGKSLLLSGELQRAIAMLTRAVAKGPADLETDFMLGRAYMSSNDYAKATDVFNRLVKYQPDCARFYALLGAAYRNSGRIMESLKILEQSNAANPDNVPLQVNLAQTYFDLGWYDKAEQLLRRALEKNPDVTDLYVDLGVLFWYTGKHKEAGDYFEKASRMGKNVQSAINNEANILALSGNVNKAIDLYKKADKVGGKNEIILTNLANAYLTKNRFEDAAACFDAVLQLSPNNLDVLVKRASIAEKRMQKDDAILYLRKILDVSPHNKNALSRMAGIMMKRKQYKEAIDPVEAYLNDFPLDNQFLLLQAELYRQMGWYEVAIMKYEAIVKDFPGQAAGYLGLAKSMFDLIQFKNGREYDRTIFYLKTAADLDKTSPEPEYLMGMIYMDYKNYRELALDSYRAALSKATDPAMKKTLNDLIAKAGK